MVEVYDSRVTSMLLWGNILVTLKDKVLTDCLKLLKCEIKIND
jgi:hypothetical protein